MPRPTTPPPVGALASALATMALAVFFLVMAVLSIAAGHGAFSQGIALALVLWGVLVAVGAVLLWRGSPWARGPVVAAGLLHVFAFGQFVLNGAPWAALGAVAGLVAVVGAVHPATRAWLTPER